MYKLAKTKFMLLIHRGVSTITIELSWSSCEVVRVETAINFVKDKSCVSDGITVERCHSVRDPTGDCRGSFYHMHLIYTHWLNKQREV